MPVVKITGQGLSAIALSVALLWGFLLAETLVIRRAARERTQAIEQIRRLRRPLDRHPVIMPKPQTDLPAKPALG